MTKSLLFLPVALLGLALFGLSAPAVLWVPVLLVGLVGTVAFAALGARHDDELRAEATGVVESQRPRRDVAAR